MYAVMWGLYVAYIRDAVEHVSVICQVYFSRAYISNLKYMFTSAHGQIIYCIEFLWGSYTNVVVSYVHMK